MPANDRIELVRRGDLLTLYIGGRPQGHRDMGGLGGNAGDTMAGFALLQRPRAKRALVVGVGLGEDVRRLRARGVETEAVELRAPVAYLASSLGAGPIEVADGREAWQERILARRRFDLVILDACTGPGTPPTHLWSDGAPAELRKLVQDAGLLLVRVIDAPQGAAQLQVREALAPQFVLAHALYEGIIDEAASTLLAFVPARRARACSPGPLQLMIAPLAASLIAGCSGQSPPPKHVPVQAAPAPVPPAVVAVTTPSGDAPVSIVGTLAWTDGHFVLARATLTDVREIYVLDGPSPLIDPLRTELQRPDVRAANDKANADLRKRIRACMRGQYEPHISDTLVRAEGRVVEGAPIREEPLSRTNRLMVQRVVPLLGPTSPAPLVPADCAGRAPLWDVADAFGGERLDPKRAFVVEGYIWRGAKGEAFLDVPHGGMGALRFALTGAAAEKIPAAQPYSMGDISSDATPEQLRTTLMEVFGMSDGKRNETRMSATWARVSGHIRPLARRDPDDFVQVDRTYKPRIPIPELPEGGVIYELGVDAVDIVVTRRDFDAFFDRDIRPLLAELRKASGDQGWKVALAVSAAISAHVPLRGGGLVSHARALLNLASGVPPTPALGRLSHLAAIARTLVVSEGTLSGRSEDAVSDAALEYIVRDLEQCVNDRDPLVRDRARSLAKDLASQTEELVFDDPKTTPLHVLSGSRKELGKRLSRLGATASAKSPVNELSWIDALLPRKE